MRGKPVAVHPGGVQWVCIKPFDHVDELGGEASFFQQLEKGGEDNRVEGLGQIQIKNIRGWVESTFGSQGNGVVRSLVPFPETKLTIREGSQLSLCVCSSS